MSVRVLRGIVVGVIFAFVLVSDSPGEPPELRSGAVPVEPLDVEVVVVKRGRFRQVDRTAGQIQAETVVPIQARLGGYVESVTVDTGDAVKAGQTLVTLSAPDLIAARETLTARLNLAEVERSRVETLLRHTRERTTGPSIELAEADLRAATARREVARAEVRKADVDLSSLRLVAPIDGVVTAREVVAGQLATPGGPPLLVVSKLDTVRVRAFYPTSLGLRLRPGDAVKIDGGLGPAVDARVSRVGVTADPKTGGLPVDVFLKNPENRWCVGTCTVIEVDTTNRPNALLIPVEAILHRSDVLFSYKVANGHLQAVAIRVGDANEDGLTYELTSGLAEGDVVLKGSSTGFGYQAHPNLSDGSPVRIGTPLPAADVQPTGPPK